MTTANVTRLNYYLPALSTEALDDAFVNRVNFYAVAAPPPGHLKAADDTSRPAYRTGARPYVEFGSGESLQVQVSEAGFYEWIALLSDGSFNEQTLELSAGLNDIPAVEFNQAVLIVGPITSVARQSIKLTMESRVTSVSLP